MLTVQNEEIRQQKEEISSQRDEITVQRDLATQQRDIIAEQKKEITDSINYAQRIQQALLPDISVLSSLFERGMKGVSDCFILFKPRNIVSGDFYWITHINEWIIFTVADCTGHGVPGAFMSMLGISFLNEIVRKKEVTQANHVLNQLRQYVIEALKQQGKTGEQQDGMDIALIAINMTCLQDMSCFQCQFAGANNPLFIISSDPQGHINKSNRHSITSGTEQGDLAGRLIEIKGDNMPIGIYSKMDDFTNNIITVQKGDTLYLFSDGYIDQFGGEKGKKFSNRSRG